VRDFAARKLEELSRRCRPLTVQRRAVLEALVRRRDHPSADQVWEDVRARLPGVSRTTVYRVLDALATRGVVRALDGPGARRYEARTERHHHAVCRVCGRIADVADARLDRLPVPRGEGFAVEDYSVHFTGRCRACSRRKA
jgi:Fur family transcriptional regulator, peroxide stress response regulator